MAETSEQPPDTPLLSALRLSLALEAHQRCTDAVTTFRREYQRLFDELKTCRAALTTEEYQEYLRRTGLSQEEGEYGSVADGQVQ